MHKRSLSAGAVLLSVWSGLNLLVAIAVTAVTFSGRMPPALQLLFTDAEIGGLDPKVLAVVNAQAALANPCIAALCALVLVILWKGIVAQVRWTWWAVAAALCPLQVFGFASDAVLGHRNLLVNLVSSAILLAGLALSGYGLKGSGAPARA
jgi:hypothetical protein